MSKTKLCKTVDFLRATCNYKRAPEDQHNCVYVTVILIRRLIDIKNIFNNENITSFWILSAKIKGKKRKCVISKRFSKRGRFWRKLVRLTMIRQHVSRA